MRDLIGGRWKTVESFLLDVGLAVGFLIVADLLLVGVRIALGTIDLHNMAKAKDDALRMLGPLAPHTYLEAGLFVLLSVCAGLFEEIIFRGYLQRQFGAISQNAVVGIAASAADFWAGAWISRRTHDDRDRHFRRVLRNTGAPAQEPASGNDGACPPGFVLRHRALFSGSTVIFPLMQIIFYRP